MNVVSAQLSLSQAADKAFSVLHPCIPEDLCLNPGSWLISIFSRVRVLTVSIIKFLLRLLTVSSPSWGSREESVVCLFQLLLAADIP